MKISILHLSDLHIVNKNGTYSEVLGNLIGDIKKQCQYLQNIIIVITGDIVDKAKFSSENIAVVIEFFKALSKALGNKVIGIQVTPGNHDKEQHEFNKKLVDVQRESDVTAKIESADWQYYLVSYKKYIELVNGIRQIFNRNSRKLDNSYYVESIDMERAKIIFVSLDTSWASYGGIIDKRKLCIDENQLNELKNLYQREKNASKEKTYLTILIGHHPFDWFKEKDEALISSWLLNSEYFNIDFYLCGHTHDRQIKSYFDTYKSYITLVTGIGWDERNAEDQKDSHRYSVYNLNLRSNSCEILIRKTCTNGTFDYDNDVLLTKKEKKDKRIHLPIKPFNCRPVIEIPVYINDEVKNEYLFIDNCTVEKIKVISELFYTISNHMKQFQASHIHDFFIKFELDKKSKGTIKKQDIYNDYFYKNIENDEVTELFANIKNREIIYENFLSYLRELCGSVAR